VGGLIAARLGVTVPLALLAIAFAGLIGVGLGVLAALRPNSPGDRVIVVLSAVLTAAPNFWLGMVMVLVFAGGLHWLPPGGFVPWQQNFGGALVSLLLPALALGLPVGCALAITVRDALVAARTSDYVLAERARGIPERDAFRNDGLPAATLAVLKPAIPQAAAIVLGTVIVENVFYLPGLGRLILDAVTARDLALVSGALVVLVLLIGVTTFLLQIGFAWADPRRRHEATA
jgi:peptide/nickel transport system permease protein